jgi:CHAT domain-containing protein
LALLLWAASGALSCGRAVPADRVLDGVNQAFVHGELERSQSEAERGYQRFRNSEPSWAWRLRISEAKAALWRGLYEQVIELLSSPPAASAEPDLKIATLTLVGVANSYLHNFSEAERALNIAAEVCSASEYAACGDLLQARGLLASERGQSDSAKDLYRRSLSFAGSHGDRFLGCTSLLNLGAEALSQGHFDEAIDQSRAAYDVARTLGARVVELVTQGNIAWAYYKLGDSERALEQALEAEKTADRSGDISDRENLLTNLGYIYMDQRKFDLAAQSFQQALQLAKGIEAKQDIYNALRVLARLGLQTGDPDKANGYAEQALQFAHEGGVHADELYPMLVQGQVAARRGDVATAQQLFEAVQHDPACPVSLKWEAQHSLARLYEGQKQLAAADHQYRIALGTFEAARATVQHEDFRLSFLTNGARIYDDYVHFLVAQGKPDQALRWADYSRARTLSEGLGLLSNEQSSGNAKQNELEPPPLDARSVARRAGGTLLFFWLGEKQSYLWGITPQKAGLLLLPPGSEIEAAVQHYRAALNGPQDVLQSDEEGSALYRMLIAPAQSLLAQDGKVFILPDGALNNLNFETLVVPSRQPHYWIEDADVVNASSLRVLAASLAAKKTGSRRLLLIGDSVAASKDYPELPKAADQMASVARDFPALQQHVYRREQATPAAYLQGHPEQFSHIHFVAHGTASRLSPLDSAIVLSKEAADPDSFKLYARDIIHHRLRADLVTISACYGAGERQYSGEGLVGLAWAFQRAGARNVIAALWEVTDASTDQLMDRFYKELAKGATPDAALRTAKLALLRSSSFHSPFYWAPFQLYVG